MSWFVVDEVRNDFQIQKFNLVVSVFTLQIALNEALSRVCKCQKLTLAEKRVAEHVRIVALILTVGLIRIDVLRIVVVLGCVDQIGQREVQLAAAAKCALFRGLAIIHGEESIFGVSTASSWIIRRSSHSSSRSG